MNNVWKRALSLALSGVLLVGSLPMSALATEETEAATESAAVVETQPVQVAAETQPVETEPVQTEPPATEPPATEPPATEAPQPTETQATAPQETVNLSATDSVKNSETESLLINGAAYTDGSVTGVTFSDGVLTLSNTAEATEKKLVKIEAKKMSLVIKLDGENEIDAGNTVAIDVEGALTIQGSGSLKVKTANPVAISVVGFVDSENTKHGLTVDGVQVSVETTHQKTEEKPQDPVGIASANGVTIKGNAHFKTNASKNGDEYVMEKAGYINGKESVANEKFNEGKALEYFADEHFDAETWRSDDNKHYKSCKGECVIAVRRDEGSHIGGTADCMNRPTCEICNEGYGTKTSAKHAEVNPQTKYKIDEVLKKHQKVYACCEEPYEGATAVPHDDPDDKLSADNASSISFCPVCGTELERVTISSPVNLVYDGGSKAATTVPVLSEDVGKILYFNTAVEGDQGTETAPSAPGTYRAELHIVDHDTKPWVEFTIQKIDFRQTNATVSVNGSYVYSGQPQTPRAEDIVVVLDGNTLENTKYEIAECTNNTNAGTATVSVKPAGELAKLYEGTKTGTFTIQAKAPAISDANKPKAEILTAKADGTAQPLLKEGNEGQTDDGVALEYRLSENESYGAIPEVSVPKVYRLWYRSPQNSNYTGTVDGHIDITVVPYLTADYGTTLAELELPEGWSVYETENPDETSVGEVTAEGNTFYFSYTSAGENALTATDVPVKVHVKAVAPTVEVVSHAAHTGNAIEPTVRVTIGEKVLSLSQDYTVVYANNRDPGKATVTVKAAGDYQFEDIPKEFVIYDSYNTPLSENTKISANMQAAGYTTYAGIVEALDAEADKIMGVSENRKYFNFAMMKANACVYDEYYWPNSPITVTLSFPEGANKDSNLKAIGICTVNSERLGVRAGDVVELPVKITSTGKPQVSAKAYMVVCLTYSEIVISDVPQALNPSHTGQPQTLITEAKASSGTMKYRLKNTEYTENPQDIKATAAGAYEVFYCEFDAQGNQIGTEKSTKVMILPAVGPATYGQSLGNLNLGTGFSWNAENPGTEPVGNVGKNTFLIDYEPPADGQNGNSDVANQVGVSGYEIKIQVNPLEVEADKVTVSLDTHKKHTGSAVKQEPIVKIGEKTLTKDVDYQLRYSNEVTKPGKVTVTISGINYSFGEDNEIEKFYWIYKQKQEKLTKDTELSADLETEKYTADKIKEELAKKFDADYPALNQSYFNCAMEDTDGTYTYNQECWPGEETFYLDYPADTDKNDTFKAYMMRSTNAGNNKAGEIASIEVEKVTVSNKSKLKIVLKEPAVIALAYKAHASYKVTTATSSNGTIKFTVGDDTTKKTEAEVEVDKKITVHAEPKSNYKLTKVQYTYKDGTSTKAVTVKQDDNGNYTFKMPAREITIKATFEKVAANSKNPYSGDSSNIQLWVTILAASAVAIVALMVFWFRKRRK